MTKIIGVDPGLTKTGWGVIQVVNNSFKFIASGTIHTDAKLDLAIRLQHLHTNLIEAVKLHTPIEAAIEETFINMNPASSLKLGHARGSLMLSLGLCGLPVSEYSTTAIKKAVVGAGRAEKHQIARMIQILMPQAKFKTEDEADALATAICHVNNRLRRIF
ncbi:MAG: crossover junction endodeoxyribonuclease RuvC [Rickettsiales bacterium]|nr:crossover junction endodeoxyribonuclease RuvC [Rickettsiales bacterium]